MKKTRFVLAGLVIISMLMSGCGRRQNPELGFDLDGSRLLKLHCKPHTKEPVKNTLKTMETKGEADD